MSPPSRRDILRASGVSIVAIAGCANQNEPSDETTTVTQATRTRATTRRTQTRTDTTQKTTKNPVECSLESLPEEGWPLPDRDPANTNYAPTATSSAETPSVRWRQRAEPPKSHEQMRVRFTDPVVTDDRVFAGKELVPSSHTPMPDENALHAYDRASGEQVWTYSTGDEVPRVAGVMGDTVYVATTYTLHAVNRSEGTRRWTFDPTEDIEAMLPMDSRIYVACSGSIVALGVDGDVTWATSVNGRITARPAVANGTVYVGTDYETVIAFGTDDGRKRWSTPLAASASNDPDNVLNLTVTGCGLLGTANGTVVALTPDGSVRWRATGKHTSLSTDGTTVYAGTADGHLRALSIADGTPQWKASLGIADPQMADGIYEDPVVTDENVYVSSRPESIYSLDKHTGRKHWRLTFDSLAHAGKPVVVRDELFVSVGEMLIAYT